MATGKQYKWLGIQIVLLCVSTSLGYHDYCLLDDDGSNPHLGKCLELGEKFLSEYTHLLRRGKTPANTCSLFEPFSACIRPLLEDCASVRHVLHSHWRPVIDLLHCSCNTTMHMHECHTATQCFEHESSHMMLQSCDQLYKLNRRLRTRKRCHFLRESIHCKTALLETACGERSGKFGHHLSMLVARNDIEKLRCYVQPDTSEYTGFSYSKRCPSDLQHDMLKCRDLHPPSQWLEFDAKYTYIPREGKKLTHRACKTYSQYRTCLEPHLKQCPEGIQRLHSIEGELRTYVLMMDYICLEVPEQFASHSTCYKDVIKNNSLQCSLNGLRPFQNVTSYVFYCQSNDKMVLAMQQEFESIRSCIENHITHQCGSAAGSVISELIRRVFAEPILYKPDCSAHNVPTQAITPSTVTDSNWVSAFSLPGRFERVAGQNESQKSRAGESVYRLEVFMVICTLLWTMERMSMRT